MKLSTKVYILGAIIGVSLVILGFQIGKQWKWGALVGIALASLFCIFDYLHSLAIERETFETGDVFCFKHGSDFKIAINRLINSKVDACIKLDHAQRKVLQTGAYNLFVTESGQKIIRELRLTFDLSVRASAANMTLPAMQSVFAQVFNSDGVSKLVYFQNLPKESLDSLSEMLGITMH